MATLVSEIYDINRVFPWLERLSPEQTAEFYADFFNALEQALQEKNWSVLEATIESWHATAEILASAELTAILTESASDDLEDWNGVDKSN